MWLVGEHCQWRVVTHRGCRLLALGGHRDDGSVDVFLAEAELQFLAGEVLYRVFHLTSAAEFLQLDAVGVEPLAVRMLGSQTLLDFAIVVYLAFLCVDEENLTRLQTTFLCHLGRIEVHDAYLGGHYHHVVLGDGVAGRAKTVSVEHTAGIASVAEEQSGRSVPRFHQDRVILVEGLEVFRDRILVVEALWHHDSHGVRQRQTAHHEELEYIVEAGRVAHARLYDRRDFANVAQSLAAEHTFACLHPAAVASYGVDFTVVAEQTERLSQAPCREGVGREA